MVIEAPRMNQEQREQALNAEIAILRRRNAWLERQVVLERAGVERASGVESELRGLSVKELAALPKKELSELFVRSSMFLHDARMAERRDHGGQDERNLEWNGQMPHPKWREISFNFVGEYDDKNGSHWIRTKLTKHDGKFDYFSLRREMLGNFREETSPLFSGNPKKVSDGVPVGLEVSAEILDFMRGSTGGMKLLHPWAVHYPSIGGDE